MDALPRLMILVLVLSTIAILSHTAAVTSSSRHDHVRIVSAERSIDLSSHIIRVSLTLKAENIGRSSVSELLLAFAPAQVDHVAFIKAALITVRHTKKRYRDLDVFPTDLSSASEKAKHFSISLLKPLNSGESVSVEVIYILTHYLEPFPKEISQAESQLVYFRDSAIILSPYNIKHQVTFIRAPSSKYESFTPVDPNNIVKGELKYGPYDDRDPYSFSSIIVHFENNNPFATVEELEREIEISHWGNLQVTESYRLVHAGARLKGVFSRLEYQSRSSIRGVSSFNNLLLKLPPKVRSVYYRDEIGNISTSHLRTSLKKSELEIEPRYPLFGGWKTTFVVGYGLPLEEFVFHSSDGRRYLNFTFGCPLSETLVEKLIIKIVLPEGSKDPSAVVPFDVRQHVQKSFSYLDILGRVVMVLEKENVVPEHRSHFQVYYDFNKAFMLAEPLMLTLAFFLFFAACIAFLHSDFSIHNSRQKQQQL